MLTETLATLRHIGHSRLTLLFALSVGAQIALSSLGDMGSAIWIVPSLMIGHLLSRAAAQNQLLFSADSPRNFPHIARYALANLWVYGLVVLAMLPGVAIWSSPIFSDSLPPLAITLPLAVVFTLLLTGTLTLFGTALPAAAMGAAYGPPTALNDSRGQRWPLFRALLLGPGLITALNLMTVFVGTPEGETAVLPSEALNALDILLYTLSQFLTAAILAVAWRRRHRPTTIAEVFE